ncbi:hypothetical protein GOODEAATRI_003471 [Goodea atripinnis]|uniref:Ankyrin repeat domain 52 n=1 Tax=Goodea atripinnis TaxID=208336 RepID=A0ABV0NKI9_9TELE
MELLINAGHLDVLKLLLSHIVDVMCKEKHGYTPLHVAAASGHVEAVRCLLRLQVEPDEPNNFGNTALHMACHTGQDSVATELVNSGANINQPNHQGNTPLHLATISSSGVLCLELLVNNGADVNIQNKEGKSPLHMAAMHGRFTSSQILIQNGSEIDCLDVNGNTPLHVAARYGQELLTSTLLTNGAARGRCLDFLLDSGANPTLKNSRGYSAAMLGSDDSVLALLEHGASALCRDSQGKTPLHLAASCGHTKLLHILLKAAKKADPLDSMLDFRGYTPTHWAAYHGRHCMQLLIQGALLGSSWSWLMEFRPLHIAARKGLATVVQVLLSRGAAVMAVDEDGHTPALACAPNKNVADCLALILSTMRPFPPREADTASHFGPVLKNCSIAATCGSNGNLCHA